jgi:putative DNA primase/helicase
MPVLADRKLARDVRAAVAENRKADGLPLPSLPEAALGEEEAVKIAAAQAAILAERHSDVVVVDDAGQDFCSELSENSQMWEPPREQKSARLGGWETPHPLTAEILPKPYPLDALPGIIQAVIAEVRKATQAPPALVAASALSAVSAVCQVHIDVARGENLRGGVQLFFMTVAESGERKSACDRLLFRAIREYDKAQGDARGAAERLYHGKKRAWEAKQNAVEARIRALTKKGEDATQVEKSLLALAAEKPEPPRCPRLLYVDTTPEALGRGLASYPAGALVSAEGGLVLDGRGMSKDSGGSMVALMNQCWDGAGVDVQVDRKSSDSFVIRTPRLTVGLALQDAFLRGFVERLGDIVRGSGWFARFLFCRPPSTMGERLIDPQADDGKALGAGLAAFERRCREILDIPVRFTKSGRLECALVTMSPEARLTWVDYHNDVEKGLGRGGAWHDVRDAASKSAEIAVRLAALFQFFSDGGMVIEASAMRGAVQVAGWYLHEARRFAGEIDLSSVQKDGMRLNEWLIDFCEKNGAASVGRRTVRLWGPVRDSKRLEEALGMLADAGYLREGRDGRKRVVYLNPKLIESATVKKGDSDVSR